MKIRRDLALAALILLAAGAVAIAWLRPGEEARAAERRERVVDLMLALDVCHRSAQAASANIEAKFGNSMTAKTPAPYILQVILDLCVEEFRDLGSQSSDVTQGLNLRMLEGGLRGAAFSHEFELRTATEAGYAHPGLGGID